ncbi:MAG TPA: hypothetical protein DHV22_04940 [Xanthomarina gelatinilytica]|uniref:2-dehydropantoate 2-reductase n=1 Tax=Xanthomarina gelatinilytica TaxID=1137281 RepID=A0A3D6BSG6_9FLAO|nr:hypothetical protein [Xanthomarina gelatinilytica]
MKIGILGIGGIGGFVGASLAKYYKNNPSEIEIVFICRGKIKAAIESDGLVYTSKGITETVFPHLVSDDPRQIGKLDFLLVTTKSYSLIDAIKNYQECLDQNSTIVTLQNMVNAKELIEGSIDSKFNILEGCIYVASNINSPGHVTHLGGPGKILIGGNEYNKAYQSFVNTLLLAGVDITFLEDIHSILWKKYLFVAPVAAVTTAYDVTFGELLENTSLQQILREMMCELQKLALAKGVELSYGDIETSVNLLTKFPYEAKSSLQLDYENSKPNEKQYLVDYVIEECKKEGIYCPVYNQTNKLMIWQ